MSDYNYVDEQTAQAYEDQRRDEVASEYFAPSYDSMPPHYQPAVDYILELERRLHAATGEDVRSQWMLSLMGAGL